MGDNTIASSDVYDFVARLRGWFPGVDFGRHAGALFEAFQPIRLVNPDSIRRQLNLAEPMTDAGRTAVEMLNHQLQAQGHLRFSMDPNSSDLLLVLLLPKIGNFLRSSLADASTEGVARVRWFAERFVDGLLSLFEWRSVDGQGHA